MEFHYVVPGLEGLPKLYQVENWFYKPIEEQGPNRAFTILFLIIPVYERYLRHACNYEGSSFGIDSPPIAKIGADLGIDKAPAREFWDSIRNGLLHRGAPKSTGTRYILKDKGAPVSKEADGTLSVNAYALRSVLMPMFRENPDFWDNLAYPVPDEIFIESVLVPTNKDAD